MFSPAGICAASASNVGAMSPDQTAAPYRWLPADFRDRATYADPHQYPSGSRTTVLVNGAIVVENSVHTGALPGKVLRRDHAGRVS